MVTGPAAALGLWVTWRRRPTLAPYYMMLLICPATVAVFYIFGRYRHPVVALLIPFAGAGIV